MNNQKVVDMPLVPPLPTVRPTIPPPSQRHAAAVAEIKALEEGYQSALSENVELKRVADRLLNKNELLQNELDRAIENGQIYQRKLIRLAAAMSGVNALTAEADKIMRDLAEVTEAQAETDKRIAEREKQG